MLTHNHTVSKNEPAWASIEKDRLPRNAYADMGDSTQVNDPSAWSHPHHHVINGEVGPSGVYTKGQMFLHQEGLRIALSETRKLGKDHPVRQHLLQHGNAIILDTEAAISIIHGSATTQAEEIESTASHSAMTDYSLRAIAEGITNCESLESLKAVEDSCLLHFSEAEKSGKNWIQKNEAKSMSGQVQQLVSYRRRAIMSLPEIQKQKELYDLGRAIGKGGI